LNHLETANIAMACQKGESAELGQWKREIASSLPLSVATDESLAGPAAADNRKFQPAFRTREFKGNASNFLCYNNLGELGANLLFLFCQRKHDRSKMVQRFY
jgi:hypothetical protein